MPTLEHIDSPNLAAMAIERWKRGLTVIVLTVLGIAPGLVACALGYLVGDLLDSRTLSGVAGALGFICFAPWGVGQRSLMRQIGKLAEVDDR